MKKYPKYKNTNIDWLEQIPEHWEAMKLKYIGDSIMGLTYSPDDVVEHSRDSKLVLRSSNIQKGILTLKDTVYLKKEIPERLILRIGDILLCSRNGSRKLIGKNIKIDERVEGETFGAFMTIFRTEFSDYLYLFFNSNIFTSQSALFLTTTINQLTINTLNNFYVPLPPLPEQKAIAEYLDKKTSEIDQIIDAKKKLIALYNEEKSALINRAVTKGIDDKAKLKPSGVEWLGDIPQHWEVTRLANFGRFHKGKGISKSALTVEGIQAVIYGDIYTKYNIKTEKFVRRIPESITKDSIEINKNDLLFTASGETREDIGKCLVFTGNEKAFAGGDVIIFRQNINNSLFLSYLLNSSNIREQKAKLSKGQIVVHIYSSQLRDIYFGLPPLKEQEKIVDYIEKNVSVIDKKVANAKRLIELMTEYRTTLINEVVTGKVKVV